MFRINASTINNKLHIHCTCARAYHAQVYMYVYNFIYPKLNVIGSFAGCYYWRDINLIRYNNILGQVFILEL